MYLFGCLFLSMLVAGGRRSPKLFLHQIYFYSIIFYLTHCLLFKHYLVKVLHLKSLLNKVPRLPKCTSVWVSECLSTQVPEYPSAQVPWVFECLSTLRVPECLEYLQCPTAQEPWVPECPWSALWVPNFPLSGLQVKGVCNITRNGLAHSFIEFLKTFQNTYFYITLIVFSFLGTKMYKFYQILLARCNHSKRFQKCFLKYSVKFRKTKYDGVRSYLLCKIVVLQLQCTVLLLQL